MSKTQQQYLMESGDEGQRIEDKTDIDATMALLKRAGLRRGDRALDVGCASGSTTRAMAGLTAPNRVVGLDASDARVKEAMERAAADGYGSFDAATGGHTTGIRYVASKAEHMPFDDGAFDFTWARFLFEYLKEPRAVLREMIRVTRPGGLVAVADLDGNCILHHPLPEALEQDMRAVIRGAAAVGFDPNVGRKLFGYMVDEGLEEVKVDVLRYHLFAGQIGDADKDNWHQKLAGLRPVGERVLGSRERFDQFEEGFKVFLDDPRTFTYSVLMIAVGKKAAQP